MFDEVRGFVLSLKGYHDGGDDGDEGIAVGQQAVGGLGAAASVSVGRRHAAQERGGGRLAPGLFLLRILFDVVLYNVTVVVPLHRGAAGTTDALFANSGDQLMEGAEVEDRLRR